MLATAFAVAAACASPGPNQPSEPNGSMAPSRPHEPHADRRRLRTPAARCQAVQTDGQPSPADILCAAGVLVSEDSRDPACGTGDQRACLAAKLNPERRLYCAVDGRRHGRFFALTAGEERVKESGEYRRGVRVGAWHSWGAEGRLMSIATYGLDGRLREDLDCVTVLAEAARQADKCYRRLFELERQHGSLSDDQARRLLPADCGSLIIKD